MGDANLAVVTYEVSRNAAKKSDGSGSRERCDKGKSGKGKV